MRGWMASLDDWMKCAAGREHGAWSEEQEDQKVRGGEGRRPEGREQKC